MSDAEGLPGPLADLRILELANETGQFCGKLLGDLGADVVKIEPPGGELNRQIGPFLDDVWRRSQMSFWKRSGRASCSLWDSITSLLANTIPG